MFLSLDFLLFSLFLFSSLILSLLSLLFSFLFSSLFIFILSLLSSLCSDDHLSLSSFSFMAICFYRFSDCPLFFLILWSPVSFFYPCLYHCLPIIRSNIPILKIISRLSAPPPSHWHSPLSQRVKIRDNIKNTKRLSLHKRKQLKRILNNTLEIVRANIAFNNYK